MKLSEVARGDLAYGEFDAVGVLVCTVAVPLPPDSHNRYSEFFGDLQHK